MAVHTKTQITNFPNELGWQGRERGFKLFNEVYGNTEKKYAMFKYQEKRTFEKEYSSLNTEKEYVYVCEGNFKDLLNDISIYDYNKNQLVEEDEHVLMLRLVKTSFRKDFIRQPKKEEVKGEFYLLTEGEFRTLPFSSKPITDKRDIFLGVKLNDSVEMNKEMEHYISSYLTPIKTNEEKNTRMKYTPIIVNDVKNYVPKTVNKKALELAVKHDLTNLELNFLNYFYEKNKALRNDKGQLFFDTKSKGIGWGHDREWVRKKMKKLIELGLVKFEIRHDCRDGRYTSWYFYDAESDLDNLKHDF